jgi:hypothetical protein
MKSTGSGDYSKERHKWLPKNLREKKEGILEHQKKNDISSHEPAEVTADPVKITGYTRQRKQ